MLLELLLRYEQEVSVVITYLLIGVAAGFASGFLGVGGGVIVVPALAYIFTHNHLHPTMVMHVAVATSLAIMIFTSMSALYAHSRAGNIHWSLIRPMLPGLILSSFVGACLSHLFSSYWLSIFFVCFLLWIARPLLFSRHQTIQVAKTISLLKLRIISVLTGILCGILGVSGGAILGPFFLRAGLDLHEAAGTSVICGMTVGLAITLGFLLLSIVQFLMGIGQGMMHYVDGTAFCFIAIASVMTAPLGAITSRYVPKKIAQRIFGILLLLTATNMLI